MKYPIIGVGTTKYEEELAKEIDRYQLPRWMKIEAYLIGRKLREVSPQAASYAVVEFLVQRYGISLTIPQPFDEEELEKARRALRELIAPLAPAPVRLKKVKA